MNITGVTQTAPILPQTQVSPQPPAVQRDQMQVQNQAQGQATGADVISASMAASVQVMDMAQQSFEDSANQLIETMAAATGVGQNFDIRV